MNDIDNKKVDVNMTKKLDHDIAHELGQLTTAIKYQGQQLADLKEFVEVHMSSEEVTTIRTYKWLAVLTTVFIASHAAELDWTMLIGVLI